MECRASHQNTSDAMTGHSSKPQEVSNRRLGLVGERMLWDWFQSERNTVWEEAKVNAELHNLALVLEQQSAVDSGICLDQWALGRTQSAQPFNDLKQQLISSISLSRQASTILMANTDYLAGHCHQIKQATTDATPKAFLPVRERDLFNLGSQPTIMGEINPAYQGPLFPDFCMEQTELESIMGDQVSQEVQTRILTAVRQAHSNNLQQVLQWDSKVRSLLSGLGVS